MWSVLIELVDWVKLNDVVNRLIFFFLGFIERSVYCCTNGYSFTQTFQRSIECSSLGFL
jgi:hypothetical protein